MQLCLIITVSHTGCCFFIECSMNCATCMDETLCTSCLPGYFLFNGQCTG